MRKFLIPIIAAAWALALLGSGPCEPPELADSIDPIDSYLDGYVSNGDKGVPPQAPISYYVGKAIDPATITNVNVVLQQGATVINGVIETFDIVGCDSDPVFGCPRGFDIKPGAGVPCDLDPNTTYQLVINVTLDNGDTYTKTITFTTGDFPNGYVPNLCSAVSYANFIVSGNTLDETSGIGGNLTSEAVHQLEIGAVGIETNGPTYYGHEYVANPKYVAILGLSSEDFSNPINVAAGTTVLIKIEGKDFTVHLPAITIPIGETAAFYISDDGSSYYLFDGNTYQTSYGYTFNLGTSQCDDTGYDCPSLTPNLALVPGNLAQGADGSPSTNPLLVEADCLNPDDPSAIHGVYADGIVGGSTDLRFQLWAIQPESPYWGWENFNGLGNFRLSSRIYYEEDYGPAVELMLSPYLLGRYDRVKYGDVFSSIFSGGIATPNSILLINIENKDTSNGYVLFSRTLDVTDLGVPLTVSLPDLTIPAGESLPLYVADDGSTFFAYDVGNHTLDLWLNGCDGDASCPLLDPAAALGNAPAAP